MSTSSTPTPAPFSIDPALPMEQAFLVVSHAVAAGQITSDVAAKALAEYDKQRRAAAKAAATLPYRKTASGTVWCKLFKAEKGVSEVSSLTLSKRGWAKLLDYAKDGTLATIVEKWDTLPLSSAARGE